MFPRSFRRVSIALGTGLVALLATVPATAETPFDGHWKGSIAVPTGPLELDIDLRSDAAETLSGDITIPIQGIRDMALGDFVRDGRSLSFHIPGIPGDPTFDGALSDDGSTFSGAFRQGGGEFTFSLRLGGDPIAEAKAALEGFDAVAEQTVGDFQVPGVAIAIVRGGEVVYAKGFGHRNVEQDLPMTADTLFSIGSTTKAMVATVLGMLVDDGQLDWDEPLVRYLPGFRLEDPMVTARITPRDLVTHRSGMPRHDRVWYNNNGVSRAELIERFEHLELTADLRERFQYNNLMFMTAGYLAGQLEGDTWESVTRRRLFEPLGMERSNFSVEDAAKDPDHALPYRKNDDDELVEIPFRNIDVVGPAGSVGSSVHEMARWLLFNLSRGEVDGQALIQASTLAEVHAPQMTVAQPGPDSRIAQEAYGMGWFVEVYRGHRRLSHGGGIDGFTTSVMFFPDDDLGLVAFTNRGSGLSSLLNQVAADRILGLEPVDWLGEALQRAEAVESMAEEAESKKEGTKVAGTAPSHDLDDYVGTYGHPGYGELRVERTDEALRFTYNGITTPLEHWHYNVWSGAPEDGADPTFSLTQMQFRSNFDGQISEVLAPFELTAAPIVFEKQPDPKLSDPEFLARFTGAYVGATGQRTEIQISGDRLTLSLPGQPLYVLYPLVSGRFGIEGLQGFSVGFEGDTDGKANRIIYYQPNGVFEAERSSDE